MQNLNYFLVVCTVAASVCVIPTTHAQDNDAQAKARQALREKLNQLDIPAPTPQDTAAQAKAREELRKKTNVAQPTVSQPVKSTPVVSQPVVSQPVVSQPVVSQPVTTQPAVSQPSSTSVPAAITTSPVVAPADAEGIEKARKAVREMLNETNTTSPDSPEVAKAREALRQKLGDTTQPVPVGATVAQPPIAGQSAEKAARAQAEAQSKAEKAARIEVEKSEAAAQAERRAKHDANFAPTAFQPIQSPELPISSSKQQRLAALLEKYRADQITPEQYHQERAKILGEP
jgi:hypothetical protein